MYSLNCKGRLLSLEEPIVMGILNVTPDSFYDGGRYSDQKSILSRVAQMMNEGASIIDVGGQSTRPGSERVSASVELSRILPVIQLIKDRFPEAILSVDTYHASVAAQAIADGVSLVNDVSGGMLDPDMLAMVGGHRNIPFVCMHMQGKPETMQNQPVYREIVKDIIDFFIDRIEIVKKAGIRDIVLDPGFGFGKTLDHNFELLRGLEAFQSLGYPIMVGLSRKGLVWKTLGISPEDALNGSTVAHTMALLHGVQILRVHDVRAAMEAIRLVASYKKSAQRAP